MEKETYDIEDILSEVRKRREETSSEKAQSEDEKPSEADEKPSEADEKPEEPFPNTEEPSAKEEESTFKKIIEKSAQAETSGETDEAEPAEEKEDTLQIVEKEADSAEAETEDNQTADDDGMVDLFALSEEAELPQEDYSEEPEKQKFFATKKGRILKTIIICLVIMIFAAGIFAGVYLYKQINNITQPGSSSTNEQQEEWQGMSKLVENYPDIQETDASQLASLQDMIKTWYYNGEPCSSSHVLNVLFLGEDTRGSDILEEGTRADSSIIVSINIDTGEITLTSVLRDAYAYWEAVPGDESTGVFGKINGAMNLDGGDIHTYINAVERLYKINIDNYVIVNFDSFKKIIDAMGGITLEITSAEIYEINNHPSRYGDVYIEKTFEGSSGEMLLDGSQALAYCRIRKIDSDNARADRQKTTLMTIFKEAKNESAGTLIKMVNALLPYVKTGFSTKNILSIAKYALTEGWLGYETKMVSVPEARINEIGGTSYGAWCWRPDYPQDAHYLQTLLYGRSGITLAQTRVDVAKCEDYGFFSEGSAPVTRVIYNNAFGEVTTYEEITAKEEEESSSSASN